MKADEARICSIVMLELWNGACGQRERETLEELGCAVPELVIDSDVWHESYELARKARSEGVTIPATDILIAACAKYHGAIIETSDADFQLLQSVISNRIH